MHAVIAARRPTGLESSLPWLGAMALLWGLSWPATQLALGSVPPLWLAAFRFGSAGLCLAVWLALRGGLRLPARADLPIVASIGLLQMMTFSGLGMIAMTVTDTSHAVLLAYTTPLWTAVLGAALLGERGAPARWAAVLTGIAGVVLICSPLETDWSAPGAPLGAGLLLTGAIAWSLVILHVRRHRWQGTPLALAPWQMALAAIPLAAAAWGIEGAPTRIDWNADLVTLLVFIGPVATSACFVISAEHGRRVSPFVMSNVALGVPMIGIASSVLLLGAALSPVFLAGLALVTAGMLLAALAARRAG